MKTSRFTRFLLAGPLLLTTPEQLNAQADTLRVVFYNCENLYDPFRDSLINDRDFLPESDRAWTYGRFRLKLVNLARALIAAGQRNPPALIGLCEVENCFVLKQLLDLTPLGKHHYNIIHEEGPDPRGVDVALLCHPGLAVLIDHRAIPMRNPADSLFRTRDVLYARLIVRGRDTLHVLVNHWPSKYGGVASSLEKRKFVATRVRQVVDSILDTSSRANVLLMGDFNEGPSQEVMTGILGAKESLTRENPGSLVNLMFRMGELTGSHKYRGEWSVLDQFVVSPALADGSAGLKAVGPRIVGEPFLLEEDEGYTGHRPFRTYAGPRYIGGYSDHLPVKVDLVGK